MGIIENMKWRHASKAMNGKQVPQEQIDKILEAINLAPTSIGLQAFKVFVVENQELKEKIRAVANDQQTITACSHLLVFAARTDLVDKDYDDYFDLIRKYQNHDEAKIQRFRGHIIAFVDHVVKDKASWLLSQTYIALGVACVAAAELKVDSVPVEGYDRAKTDEILSLKEKGYTSTVLLPLGYSDQEHDWWAKETKVRKNINDLVEYLK